MNLSARVLMWLLLVSVLISAPLFALTIGSRAGDLSEVSNYFSIDVQPVAKDGAARGLVDVRVAFSPELISTLGREGCELYSKLVLDVTDRQLINLFSGLPLAEVDNVVISAPRVSLESEGYIYIVLRENQNGCRSSAWGVDQHGIHFYSQKLGDVLGVQVAE